MNVQYTGPDNARIQGRNIPGTPEGGVSRSHALLLFAGATLTAVILRLPFATEVPASWDSVQFVLGILDFDIVHHQPHPPGYFLYIMIARVLHVAGLSPYDALVVLSITAGAGTAGVLAVWAARIFGPRAGELAAGLVILSPMAVHYSTRGDTYALSGFFATLVGYLCWRVLTRQHEALWPSAIALALAGGIRPTDAVFLFPLWLWCAWRKQGKTVAANIALIALITAIWAIPMIVLAGGITPYREASSQLSGWVASAMPLANPGNIGQFAKIFIAGAVSLMGTAWPAVLLTGLNAFSEPRRKTLTFLCLWTLPGLAMFLLVHLGQSGYLMMMLPAITLLVVAGIIQIDERLGRDRLVIFLIAVVLVNGLLIWTRVHKPALRDRRLMKESKQVLGRFDSDETAVICAFRGFAETVGEGKHDERDLDFRQAMYAAPHLRVYAFPLSGRRWMGGAPNFGYHLDSGVVRAPVKLNGINTLLLLDEVLLQYLPESARWERLMKYDASKVYRVPVDPKTPLIIGPGRSVQFKPAEK